jgi:hypothetical protein
VTEQWRPVVGFEGCYEVSDHGQIRSVDQNLIRKNGTRYTHKGRVLSPDSRKYGHRYVVLKVNQQATHVYVHRVVLEAFVGPCPEGMECRHLDGNSANNQVDNLKWGTPSENRADIIRHGNDHQLKKTHCPQRHEYGETYIRPGDGRRERICKECAKAHSRATKQRRRERVA